MKIVKCCPYCKDPNNIVKYDLTTWDIELQKWVALDIQNGCECLSCEENFLPTEIIDVEHS